MLIDGKKESSVNDKLLRRAEKSIVLSPLYAISEDDIASPSLLSSFYRKEKVWLGLITGHWYDIFYGESLDANEYMEFYLFEGDKFDPTGSFLSSGVETKCTDYFKEKYRLDIRSIINKDVWRAVVFELSGEKLYDCLHREYEYSYFPKEEAFDTFYAITFQALADYAERLFKPVIYMKHDSRYKIQDDRTVTFKKDDTDIMNLKFFTHVMLLNIIQILEENLPNQLIIQKKGFSKLRC